MKKFMHSTEKHNWVRRITAIILAGTVMIQQGGIVIASETEIVPVTEVSQAEDPSAAAAGESEVKSQTAEQQTAETQAAPETSEGQEASQAEPAKQAEEAQVVPSAEAAQSNSDIIEEASGSGSAISSSDAADASIKDGIIAESEEGEQSAPAESETDARKVDTLSTSNQGDSINASIKALNGAVLPADAVLAVAQLNPANQEDLSVINDSLARVNDVYNTHNLTEDNGYFLDLSLSDKDGNAIKPDGQVEVTVTFPAGIMSQYQGKISSYKTYHIAEAGGVVKAIDTNAQITLGNENTVSKAVFTVDSFSPFVLVPEKSQFDKYTEDAAASNNNSETDLISESESDAAPVTDTETGSDVSSASEFVSGLTKQSETETEEAIDSESVTAETETETEQGCFMKTIRSSPNC